MTGNTIKEKTASPEAQADEIEPRERILVVEDDDQLRDMLSEEVTEAGYAVKSVSSAENALETIKTWHPDVVISDLRLPGEDGFSLLREVRAGPQSPCFLVITAFGTIPEAVEALKSGADNFLTKPLDFDHLLLCLERALEVRRLRLEVERFRQSSRTPRFHDIIGNCKPMRKLYYQIQQIAKASGPVMIHGESGSGKELVAEAIHRESDRRERPFVPVNCAGMPENLLESEFFGHVEGAFTGARKTKKGLFEEADKGVLFLDEVAELPLAMQAKLLRVLQDGKIRPVGGNQEKTIDVRVLVATHRDLAKAVGAGTFREDLYFRLETFTLNLPPLRQRGDDLELLAARFLSQYSREIGKNVRGFSAETLALLRNYPFPGNVRELQNAIKHAVTFCHESTVKPEDLPERVRGKTALQSPADARDASGWSGMDMEDGRIASLEELKLKYVHHVLGRCQGNKRRAAALLGIGRRTLYEYLKKLESPQETES